MKKLTVAVARDLGPVGEELRRHGYRVIDWDGGELEGVDALVVSGVDDDLTGVQTTNTRAPVVAAAGMSPAEIVTHLQRRLS